MSAAWTPARRARDVSTMLIKPLECGSLLPPRFARHRHGGRCYAPPPSSLLFGFRVGAVVGGDDVAHQPVAHDVALAEVAEADAVDAGEDLYRVLEPRRFAGG